MAAEDAGGGGDLAILVNTEMIILKGAVKAQQLPQVCVTGR